MDKNTKHYTCIGCGGDLTSNEYNEVTPCKTCMGNASWDDGYGMGQADGFDHGFEEGYGDGHEQGCADGYANGRADGYREGHTRGFDEGFDAGCGCVSVKWI